MCHFWIARKKRGSATHTCMDGKHDRSTCTIFSHETLASCKSFVMFCNVSVRWGNQVSNHPIISERNVSAWPGRRRPLPDDSSRISRVSFRFHPLFHIFFVPFFRLILDDSGPRQRDWPFTIGSWRSVSTLSRHYTHWTTRELGQYIPEPGIPIAPVKPLLILL